VASRHPGETGNEAILFRDLYRFAGVNIACSWLTQTEKVGFAHIP